MKIWLFSLGISFFGVLFSITSVVETYGLSLTLTLSSIWEGLPLLIVGALIAGSITAALLGALFFLLENIYSLRVRLVVQIFSLIILNLALSYCFAYQYCRIVSSI